MTTTVVQANGVSLACDDTGRGDPPFLFIHGMAGDHSLFGPQVEHYARAHRVVAYDQRGHGHSERPAGGNYETETLAEDARQLCAELAVDHPVVVGHSLGGTVAIALASRYPDFPRALVVLDSVFELQPESRAGLDAFYGSLTEESYRQAVADFVRTKLASPTDDPAVIEESVEQMGRLPREVFAALGHARVHFDDVGAAQGVTAPALFIGSARPFSDLLAVRRHCPRWYVGRVVGSGHKLQLLVPEQVNAMIDHFLALVDAGFPYENPEATF